MASGSLGISGYVVLFVFIAIALSIGVYELKKIVKLPVAPMLLIVGILLRIIGPYLGQLKETVELFDLIDHQTVILIFLPALVFETSFSTDWYTFKREIWQIIPLATTSVILSTFLTGFMLTGILGYELTLAESMIIGSMLSSTDHVSIVAQLKEIHADSRFELLMQGETLLSEGTVMVLLYVFIAEAEDPGANNWAGSIVYFIRLFGGGIALGALFALAVIICLKEVVNDEVQETNLTLVTAYLLFFTSEGTMIHVSGTIATVTYGLIMSAWGKTVISPSVEEKIHSFWMLIGHNIEAIVFILGGMLIGHQMMTDSDIGATDVGRLFECFIFLHLIRAVVIAIHFPLLRKLGYGLSLKEAFVLVLAGLKGASSIMLTLLVYYNRNLDEEVRDLSLFLTVSISALSVFLDSLALKYTVKWLGMEKLTSVQENMMIQVTNQLVEKTTHKLTKMRKRDDMKLADWDSVIKKAGDHYLITKIFRYTALGRKIIKSNPDAPIPVLLDLYKEAVVLEPNEIVKETRRRFLAALKRLYWHLFEQGQCLGSSALSLIESANRSLDKDSKKISDFKYLKEEIYSEFQIKALDKLSKVPVIGRLFRNMLYDKMMVAYDASSNFIFAHEEAEELVDQMGIDDVDKDIFEQVMEEGHHQVHKCEEFIKTHITDSYPEVMRYVQTYKAFMSLLNAQRKTIDKIYKEGVIGEIEYENLTKAIDTDIKQICMRDSASLPSLRELLCNRFPEATETQIEEILCHTEEKSYSPGQMITSEGNPAKGSIMIIKGRVKEYNDQYSEAHVLGAMVQIENLLPNFTTCSTNVEALTEVIAAFIRPEFLVHIPNFELQLWIESAPKILVLNKQSLGLHFQDVDTETIYNLVKKCEISKHIPGSLFSAEHGGVLMYGSVGQYTGLCYISPGKVQAVSLNDSIIFMHFPERLGQKVKTANESLQKIIISFFRSGGSRFSIRATNFAVSSSLQLLAERGSQCQESSTDFTKIETEHQSTFGSLLLHRNKVREANKIYDDLDELNLSQ
jgi:NhaP-type Na+/H+ or K+/H+ antiporter